MRYFAVAVLLSWSLGASSNPALAANCGVTTVGFTPLTELQGSYQGEDGGLYGGGSNVPAPAHLATVIQVGREQVTPLDAAGVPSRNGRVGLLSIGMSHTTLEFSTFQQLVSGAPELSSELVLVDGAVGGFDVRDWLNPQATVWSTLTTRLTNAGVTDAQVQAVWLKQAHRLPSQYGAFPAHAQLLRDDVTTLIGMLRDRFTNLRLLYLASRSYAGYASSTLNPEPYAYESAFAARWVIQEQLTGNPLLNPDPTQGVVEAPWVLWGPYFWADGVVARADGLVWTCADFNTDGTHPSQSGKDKAAAMLRDHFRTDPTTRPWFLQPATVYAVRRGDNVELSYTGAYTPWRIEAADGSVNAPWATLDPARPAADYTDVGVSWSGTTRLYRVW